MMKFDEPQMRTEIQFLKVCLSFLIVITSSLVSNAQSHSLQSSNSLKVASNKVESLIAKYHIKNGPGLSIAVIKNGNIVFNKGYGIANLEYDKPINSKTVFHIASVSKQFTIFSILLLEQEGKLKMDDDIRQYLPELPDYGSKITLRHLANHTSGLRDNTALANLIGTHEVDMFSNDQAVNLLLRQQGLNFKTGERHEYCNSGYILLAEIVKRVSGQTFAEFTHDRIFKPLKMDHSQFIDDPEIVIKNRAYSYHEYLNVLYKTILNLSFVGSTSLNTTTDDLCKWALNFQTMKIGNKKIFDAMQRGGKLNNGDTISYALGQENTEYKGLHIVFHGGGDADYGSYLLRVPEHNFAVVFICNSHVFHPLDFVYNIVDYYLGDKEIVSNKKPVIRKEVLQNFIGDYQIFPGYVVSISKENDTLFHLAKGDDIQNRIKLIQINENEFVFPPLPHSRFVFDNSNGQKAMSVKWKISDFTYTGQRVEFKEFDASHINLSEIPGVYYSSELKTSYEIIQKDDKLIAVHCRNEDAVLTPYQPDFFVSSMGAIELMRNEKHEVNGMYVLGQGLGKIPFRKLNVK